MWWAKSENLGTIIAICPNHNDFDAWQVAGKDQFKVLIEDLEENWKKYENKNLYREKQGFFGVSP